jgi:hypothetical protein
MRLIIALAFDLSGLMVTSGIKDTAGDLNDDIASNATNKVNMNIINVPGDCVVIT